MGLVEGGTSVKKEREAHSGSATGNRESVVICLSDKGREGG